MGFEEFCRNLVIAFVTFNRKEVTEICLDQINKTKFGSTLVVYDDCSDDFDVGFLKRVSKDAIVKRMDRPTGVGGVRSEIHNEFKKEFRFIYHTDNDAYHDPNWMYRLHELYTRYKLPTGLFTLGKRHHIIKEMGGESVNRMCQGVSFFYDFGSLEGIKYNKKVDPRTSPGWDNMTSRVLKRFIVSGVSYLEHFGANGLTTREYSDNRAYNPTMWLQNMRDSVIESLHDQGKRRELLMAHREMPRITNVPIFTD